MRKRNQGTAETDRRAAAERAAAVAALGMVPESKCGRYAATTGELVRWAREAASAVGS